MTIGRFARAAAASVALLAGACSQDQLFTHAPPQYAGGARFKRYVAMGNSITAGVQSAGILDSTQKLGYAVLVAGQMGGDPFYYPSLAAPGCPPPFTNVFTQARLGGGTGTTCAFRSPVVVPYISDVAVPSAEVLDGTQNYPTTGTNSNALTLLMLGGRTQAQAMTAAHPTFVSVWLGNNDLLGAAEAGDTTLATDTATFRNEYNLVANAIQATGASAILIAVGLGHFANGTAIPFFSRGTTWYGLATGGAFAPAPFTVLANCAPPRGDTVFVSFPYGFGLLSAAFQGTPTTLDCTAPPVLEPKETQFITKMQLFYNAIIQSIAASHSWAYTDSVNTTMDSLFLVANQFAPFPNIGNPANPNGCALSPFGLAFSCDGVHPSAGTQRLIARKIVRAINAAYSSSIPAVP